MTHRRTARGALVDVVCVLLVAAVAWGALAFGGVYAWASTPLVLAALAAACLSFTVDSSGRVNRPVALSLAVVALTVALQVLPFSRSIVHHVTPGSEHVLQRYDLKYANFTVERRVISIDPHATRRALMFLASFGLLLLGLSRVLTGRQVGRLAIGIAGIAVIVAMTGIIQRATFNGRIYGFWQPQMPSTPFGPFINRNHFAGWMLMALPLTVGLFCGLIARGTRGSLGTRSPWVVWFGSPDASRILLVGFAIVSMTLSLILSRSRLGLLGIVLAMLLVGRLAIRRWVEQREGSVAYGFALLVAIVCGVSIWGGLEQGIARFADTGARDLGGRLPIWADTSRIIRDFPLTGTGLNTYGTAMLFYQTTPPDEHVRQAHNDYLQLAAEGGLLVGIPVAMAIFFFSREVYRRFREPSDDVMSYWVRSGAVAGIIAIALQSIGEFSLQMPGNAMLFTVLCAIALHKPRSGQARLVPSSR